jgi:hypothetical protein
MGFSDHDPASFTLCLVLAYAAAPTVNAIQRNGDRPDAENLMHADAREKAISI